MKTVVTPKQGNRFLFVTLVADSFICIFDVQATAAENMLAAAIGFSFLYIASCVTEQLQIHEFSKIQTGLLCVAFFLNTVVYLSLIQKYCLENAGFSLPTAVLFILLGATALYAWQCGVQALAKMSDAILALLAVGTVILVLSLQPQFHLEKLQYTQPGYRTVFFAAARYLYSLPEVIFHRAVRQPNRHKKQSATPFVMAFAFVSGYFFMGELALGTVFATAQRPHAWLARMGTLSVLQKQDALQGVMWLLLGIIKLCCLYMMFHGLLRRCMRLAPNKKGAILPVVSVGVCAIAAALLKPTAALPVQLVATGLVVICAVMQWRKKKTLLVLCILLSLFLSACGESLSLRERAMVHGIYISKQDGRYIVSLFVQAPEKTADTAEVSVTMNCYGGSANTLAMALKAAEMQTGQSVFYEQNEVLLLDAQLTEKELRAVLEYATQEKTMRTNASVFIIQDKIASLSSNELSLLIESLESASRIGNVREAYCVRLLDVNAANGNAFYLPEVAWAEEKLQFCSLHLYGKNGCCAVLIPKESELFLALQGKQKEYVLQWQKNGERRVALMEQIKFLKSAKENSPFGDIDLLLCAQINRESVFAQNKALMQEVQARLQQEVESLLQKTFLKGIDVFSFDKVLAQQSAKETSTLQNTQAYYCAERLHLQVMLWA